MIWLDTKKNLYIHRGNSGQLTVNLSYENAPYTMNPADILVLSVRDTLAVDYEENAVLYKEFEGTNIIIFEPEDTADLEKARYYFDIKLFMSTGEEVTITDPQFFNIEPVVTQDLEVETIPEVIV